MSKSTSIAAYNELVKTKHFSILQEAILDSLKKEGPATRKELANRLNKPINSVCDPVLRLLEAGLLVQEETTCFETNKKINMLSVVGDVRKRKAGQVTTLVSKRPSSREMLCSELLRAEIKRVENCYEAEVVVSGIKFKVTLVPVEVV